MSMAGDGTAGSFAPVGSTGTVGRVADTQMGEADALGSVGAICSATSESGNVSVCEADTVGSTGRMFWAGTASDASSVGCDDTLGGTGTVGSVSPM